MTDTARRWLADALRWIGRVLAALLILMFGIFLFGEGVPSVAELSWGERFAFLALGTMGAGLVAGFHWERGGALVALLGYVLFCAIDRDLNATNPFVLFAVAALAMLASGALRRGVRWTPPRVPRLRRAA